MDYVFFPGSGDMHLYLYNNNLLLQTTYGNIE